MRPEQREVLSISIREMLSDAELMAQLAEEAAELGHAALKLRRVRDGRNCTPVTFQEAYDQLKEEISDVLLCLEVLGVDGDRKAMDAKLERWVDRLGKHGGAGHGVAIINRFPTVDAVEVVRCKDCLSDGSCCIQDAMNWTTGPKMREYFCSFGERRSDHV